MPADPFVYTVIRVVPRVERGECLNVGVVLFCRSRRVLDGRFALDRARLASFGPGLDLDAVARQIAIMQGVIAGDPAAGAVAVLPQAERFGWLSAPASTVVQPGPVHSGLTGDPATTLERLFAELVLVPGAGGPGDEWRYRL